MSPHILYARALAAAASLAALQTAALAGVIGPPEWANETGALYEADYAVLQFPASISVPVSTATPQVYGQIYEAGSTEAFGANPVIFAQLGYGPYGSDPRTTAGWVWANAAYNVQVGNNDEYAGSFIAPAVAGTYSYTYRFKFGNASPPPFEAWTLADLNGAGSNINLNFETDQLGVLTVVPAPGAATLIALAAAVGVRRRR